MLSRIARRLPVTPSTGKLLGCPRRYFRKEKGPKGVVQIIQELITEAKGGFTFKGAAQNFIEDVNFITGPVTNYIDAVEPMRIDLGKRITRFTKAHSDSEYGGLSHCSTKVLHEKNKTNIDTEGAAIEDQSFVRFSGELNFPENRDAKIKTAGFCAAQAVCRKVLDLVDFEGIVLVIRSKEPRSYIFGLKTMSLSMLNDMQYQIKLDVPGGDEWSQYHIPWSYFSLTRGGKLCEIQRVNDNMQMESMTFLVTRDQGKFQLDIKSVTVHPYMDKAEVQKKLPYESGNFGTPGRPYK